MKKIFLLLVLLTVLMTTNAVQALYFWDANGSDPGAGGPTPTGTWGVDPYWNDGKIFADPPDPSGSQGTGPTIPWDTGYSAVFSAGDDATGAFTVNVISNLQAADIHMDLGQVTFVGGPINLKTWDGKGENRLLSVGHKDSEAVAIYNTVLTGATNIIRYKRGTLIFGATNIFTGSVTIEGGRVQLGAPHVLPSTTPIILANNDPSRTDFSPEWQDTPAIFDTAGYNQNLGTLQLLGANPNVQRAIDFGNGASTLTFADSDAQDWGGLNLDIVNYTPGVDFLRIGTDGSGFDTQLALMRFIDFNNAPGRIDSAGFVTPNVPTFISITRTAPTNIELVWTTISGRFYRVQYKTNLSDPNWNDIEPDIFATGSTATMTDFSATSDQRYYRVLLL